MIKNCSFLYPEAILEQCHGPTIHCLLLRPDLISTQGPKLFEAEFGAASRSDFGGAHAGQIVGRA
jgi:hypothetical protein